MAQLSEQLKDWLTHQKELVKKLEQTLDKVPAELQEGQKTLIGIMKADIEKVESGVIPAFTFPGQK